MSCQIQAWKKLDYYLVKEDSLKGYGFSKEASGKGKAGEMVSRWVSFKDVWEEGIDHTQKALWQGPGR